MIKMVV